MPDTSSPPQPVRITLSRPVKAAVVLVVAVQLGILTLQLGLQQDQRTSVDRQLAIAARQSRDARPLIADARPLVADARAAAPALRELGREALALTEHTTPLMRDFSTARAPEQLEAAGALARTLLDAGVGDSTRAVRTISEALLGADLPRTAQSLTSLVDELNRQNRLRRLLVRSNAVLGEVRARSLVEKSSHAAEAVPRVEQLVRDSLAVQRESLEIQRLSLQVQTETREVARETRDIARETERHAESLDRKTGPSLSPTADG